MREGIAQKGGLGKKEGETSQTSQEYTCAGISFLIKIDLQLHLKRDSSTGSFCEFCEICQNTFSAEDHRTTGSDYSSIKSIEKEN